MRFISIFWYLFSVVVFFVLNYSFSIVFYNSTKLFFPILTTLLSLFFVFLGLYNVDKLSKLLYLKFNSGENNSGIKYIILFVIAIVGILSSYLIFEERVEEALVKDGIVVKAQIKDGQHEFTEGVKRKTDKYFLDLFFKTEAGLECDFKAEVPADIYKNAYADLKVDVVYLKSEPSVFKVLLNDENIKRYRNIENRNLNFKDLEKFVALPDNKKFRYLRDISGGWDTKVEDYGRVYFNALKKEAITVFYEDENVVLYQTVATTDSNLFFSKAEISSKSNVSLNNLTTGKFLNIAGITNPEVYRIKNFIIEKSNVILDGTQNYLIQKK